MNFVASSAVFGLVAVPPMAATSPNQERHVDRDLCQRGAARRGEEEVLQRQASETQQWEMQAEDLEQRLQAMKEPPQRIEQRLRSPQPGEQQILQSCRFRDSDCFVEGAMIAPPINDDLLLKEEQP